MGYKRVKNDIYAMCEVCYKHFMKSARSRKRFCSANCREAYHSAKLREELSEFRKWRKKYHEKQNEGFKTR